MELCRVSYLFLYRKYLRANIFAITRIGLESMFCHGLAGLVNFVTDLPDMTATACETCLLGNGQRHHISVVKLISLMSATRHGIARVYIMVNTVG